MENYQKVISGDGESFSVPHDGVGIGVETITGAAALTAEQSGKTLILSAAAGAAITLPEPVAGLTYKFVVGLAFATTSWTVTATDTIIHGNVLVAGAHVAGASEDTITFVNSAESLGDWAKVECDGTNWYVSGSGVTSGSITLTDES